MANDVIVVHYCLKTTYLSWYHYRYDNFLRLHAKFSQPESLFLAGKITEQSIPAYSTQ